MTDTTAGDWTDEQMQALTDTEDAEDWRDFSKAALAEVQRIAARDGKLTAESVLDAAVDPASPLHDRFEWDDGAAAHGYRLDQARRLIRAVVTVVEAPKSEPVTARAFVVAERGSGEYVRIGEARSDPDRRARLIKYAVATLRGGVTQLKGLVVGVRGETKAKTLLQDIEDALERYDA
jgi:hypothetical protein